MTKNEQFVVNYVALIELVLGLLFLTNNVSVAIKYALEQTFPIPVWGIIFIFGAFLAIFFRKTPKYIFLYTIFVSGPLICYGLEISVILFILEKKISTIGILSTAWGVFSAIFAGHILNHKGL